MRLIVNATEHTVDVDGQTPLLWVLRDHLDLTGTRFGCGRGLCGACTVLVEGQPMRACITPVALVEGRSVATIEGLGAGGLHDLQRAWIDHGVPQCGFCQAGQLMRAKALLDGTDGTPTDAEIDAAMSGNLCRCGTYPRIRAAIRAAAAEAK